MPSHLGAKPARGISVIAYNDKSGWTLRDFPSPVPRMRLRFSGAFVYASAGVQRSLDAGES
jgi:hypothetical protein